MESKVVGRRSCDGGDFAVCSMRLREKTRELLADKGGSRWPSVDVAGGPPITAVVGGRCWGWWLPSLESGSMFPHAELLPILIIKSHILINNPHILIKETNISI